MNSRTKQLTTYSTHGNNTPEIVVQERDRKLLKELETFRVVDREQAKLIAGFGSTTRANTRLLALTRTGLLRRFFLGAAGGFRKAVYALSPKGAALVGVALRGPRRRSGEFLVADFFVLHQLTVNNIHCSLKRDAVDVSLRRWVTFHESVVQTSRLIPDGYAELQTPSGTVAAFLEVDLGHERLAVWSGKLKAYLQLALSGDFESRFGQGQFRVLIVANSERRLLSIRKLVRTSTRKVFWFATLDTVSNGILGTIWLRPDGTEKQSLLTQNNSFQ